MNLFKKKYSYLLVTALLTGCGGGSSTTPTTPTTPVAQDVDITSTANISATEDVAYSYQVSAVNTDSPVYTLTSNPAGMEISNSGLITWLPLEGVLTSGEVTVTVTNADATFKSQAFTITVQPVNDQLQLAVAPTDRDVTDGNLFSHQIMITDVDDANDGQNISFQLNAASAPTGMTVSSTGLIEWQADVTQSDDFTIDVAINDGGEDATSTVNYTFELSALYYQNVTGRIVNYYTGEGLDDVELSLFEDGNSIATVMTAGGGQFLMPVLDTAMTARMTLSTDLTDYAEHALTVSTADLLQTQHIALIPSHVTTSFDPSLLANVTYQGQNLLELPASSLAREDGQAIVGEVTAQLTIIDPSLDISIMPGDMRTMANSQLVPIESYGAINVVLEDESGANINLGANQEATIRIPVASSSTAPPATIPLYYFDEQQGIWVEEGVATLTTLGGEQYYVGQVSHFTTWNADRIYDTVFINGCVVDSENLAISGAKMISTGRDYNGSSTAFTDANGDFTIPVKMNSTVLISGSQGSQSRTLTQVVQSDDITIEDCIELSAATSTVKLTWGENPRDLDTHFYGPSNDTGSTFHLYYGNKTVVVDDTTFYLDVDDTSSYGPEILTVPAFPLAGRYSYVIYKYSGSGDILQSPTRVELNLESQIRIFSPPEGEVTNYWHVFDFVVSDTGEITIDAVNAWSTSFTSNFTDDEDEGERAAVVEQSRVSNSLSKKSIKQKYYK